jgi:hypothetical protein
MVSLPLDVYRLVLEKLSKASLCRMARVCRSLQPEAERLIYRKITRDDYRWQFRNSSGGHTECAAILLCRRFCLSPRLALYVRFFELVFPVCGSSFDTTIRNLFSRALGLMPKLVHLRVRIGYPHTSCRSLFSRSMFSLRAFGSEFKFDQHLVRFLETQAELQDLRDIYNPVTRNFPSPKPLEISFSPNTLPRLSVFSSYNCYLALSMLANRPISHLSTSNIPTEKISCLRMSAASLQAFDLRRSLCPIEVLNELHQIAPNVEVLSGLWAASVCLDHFDRPSS